VNVESPTLVVALRNAGQPQVTVADAKQARRNVENRRIGGGSRAGGMYARYRGHLSRMNNNMSYRNRKPPEICNRKGPGEYYCHRG
jgi:hypothetical protein